MGPAAASGKHFLVGLKYAAYDADPNATNLPRNSASGEAFDINKVWAYLMSGRGHQRSRRV